MTYRSLERANAYFYDPARRAAAVRRHGGVCYLSSGVNHLRAPSVLLDIAARELRERMLVENYTAPGGAPAVVAAIAFETHERLGVSAFGAIGPANIAMTAGATGALAFVFRYLAEIAGARTALVLGLNYSYFSTICDEHRIAYRTCCSEEPDRILPSAAEAVALIAKLCPDIVVLTQPTNPSGEVCDAEELDTLIAAVAATESWLVFDEVPDLAHPGEAERPHPFPAKTEAFPERLIWINSFSKSRSLAGLRAGWLIADRPVVDFVRRHNERLLWSPVHAGVSALVLDMVLRAAARRVRDASLAVDDPNDGAAIDHLVARVARRAGRYLRLFSPYSDDFSRPGDLWAFLDAAVDWPQAFRRYEADLAATGAICAANWRAFESRLGDRLRSVIAAPAGFNHCVKFDNGLGEWGFARQAFDDAGLDFYTESVFADHDREDSSDYWVRISTANQTEIFAAGCDSLSDFLDRGHGA
ncbi:MAG TPA: pyridoxal phosphate-dependent aminotransferase [Aurantimonas coralicida]|uniref:Aminotransferase class I/classII large domain-containing protein n=3 Tax=root TaxID=1 RepID=A0A0F9UVU7_9ZZZZ|nr:pyridoxal phosphate-dependent aminotransferase [Aurantimonas coralicida]